MVKNGNSPLLQRIDMADDLTSNRRDPKECCHVPLERGQVTRTAIPAIRQVGIDMVIAIRAEFPFNQLCVDQRPSSAD